MVTVGMELSQRADGHPLDAAAGTAERRMTMDDLRKDCPMRHENGNCTVIGGFCTAVNDPICDGLHNAYDSGYRDAAIHAQQERENPEQITNADRIRAMSDDELKEFICSILQCEFCKFEGWGGCELLEWLQQPEEGE